MLPRAFVPALGSSAITADANGRLLRETRRLQVRLLAAECALGAGELDVAERLALSLAAARYAPAWRLAAELACPDR